MNLEELNIRSKMIVKEAKCLIEDCRTSDELEVVASMLGFLLASMTNTTDEQKANVFKVGQEARKRIQEKESSGA